MENIPPETYSKLGSILSAISLEDLQNITMDRVEIVEAFGSTHVNFDEQQLMVIASKVRSEWYGKEPHTYSEYDLVSLGQIICYIKPTDILQIHSDAFKLSCFYTLKTL